MKIVADLILCAICFVAHVETTDVHHHPEVAHHAEHIEKREEV